MERRKAMLHHLKVIEINAWIDFTRGHATIAEAVAAFGEDQQFLAWVKADEAVRAFAAKLPFGGK